MDEATCDRAQLSLDRTADRRVRDAMLAHPKTLPADATAGDARAFFANPKVVAAVLVDGTAFAGLLDREDVPDSATDVEPVRPFARRDVTTTTPDRPVQDALAALDAEGTSRLVVLDDDGVTLAGLLCLDLQRAGFCQG